MTISYTYIFFTIIGQFPHKIYALVGWGCPVILTTIWAVTTSQYIGGKK